MERKPESTLEYLLIHYRWVFVCFFLLPLSLLYDLYYALRSLVVFKLASAPTKHPQKVAHVQQQVRDWAAGGRKGAMCTARPGWQTISFRVPAYKKTLTPISVNLVDILSIDTEGRTVTVEPLVTMGQLSATLEPLGWTIPVLPELDDLTVGGLVMGTGIETSSHKYGLFQHICKEFELVVPSGDVLTCSKEENADLFDAVPWSYGTLGFLTAVKLEIIAAQRFVRMEYRAAHSLPAAIDLFNRETNKESGNEFVEGIVFSEDKAVIMTANMVTSAEPGKVNRIGLWHKPWFFKHVETFLEKGEGVEYIPLRDYYHRHSRSIFWEIQEIIPFGNSVVFRYLFGWMVPPKVSLLKLTQPPAVKKLYEEAHMIQDMLVPLPHLSHALRLFHTHTKIYPMWLCPFKLPPTTRGFVHPPPGTTTDSMYVDIGVYGVPTVPTFNAVKTTRAIEEGVRKYEGFQMLYADTYMSREEFREMFDHTLYDTVRRKYGAEGAFPEVYDKVGRHARI